MYVRKPHLLLLLTVVCSYIGPAAAQNVPEYEVASIKPVDPNVGHTMGAEVYPGGRIVLSTFRLKSLIVTAFGLSYWQISGGDAWTEQDEYNVEVKPTESLRSKVRSLRYTLLGIDDEHLRKMLQAVLIDRFQLKFHRETKTGDVYELQRSDKPLALRPTELPSASEDPSANDSLRGNIGYVGGRWSIHAMSMPQLAKHASDHYLHVPVLDRTGLTGPFDYKQPQPDVEPTYPAPTSSFRSFLTQAGLKLQRSSGPIEIFVIDQSHQRINSSHEPANYSPRYRQSV